jgi:hypothetical protein
MIDPSDFLEINTSELLKIPGVVLPTSSSMGLPPKIKLTPVTGVVVDFYTNEPIKGAQVINALKSIKKTNDKGEFKIKVPVIVGTDLDPTKFPLNVIKPKYTSLDIIPYTSTKDVKTDLGIITIQSIESDLKKEITDLLSLKNDEVEKYSTQNTTLDFHIQKKLNGSVDELKKIVIPLVLGLLAQYGVSKIQDLINENKGQLTEKLKAQITCPPKAELANIISKKNKLVHQLNNSLNTIKIASQSIKISEGVITGFEVAYQVLKVLPTPTAVAGVGIPISIINTVQDIKTFLSNNIDKIKKGNIGLSSILDILINVLEQVISFLTLLDKITQFCSGGDVTQTQISTELTALTRQQSNQLSPVVTNVNGFDMGVETEITGQPLKRRRAIARNKGGVVILQGEWSYSSIDQILIDELVFYIQQNNLKAD